MVLSIDELSELARACLVFLGQALVIFGILKMAIKLFPSTP
jgi:hypothetical protein